MAGLDRNTPIPSEIKLHQKSCFLEVSFDDGSHFQLPFEYLRVYSPSAEVRGHGPGGEILQTGKRNVTIDSVQGVGNYAIQLQFSDGHNTGIYSWDTLLELGRNYDTWWKRYLEKLEQAGASRDAPSPDTLPAAQRS